MTHSVATFVLRVHSADGISSRSCHFVVSRVEERERDQCTETDSRGGDNTSSTVPLLACGGPSIAECLVDKRRQRVAVLEPLHILLPNLEGETEIVVRQVGIVRTEEQIVACQTNERTSQPSNRSIRSQNCLQSINRSSLLLL